MKKLFFLLIMSVLGGSMLAQKTSNTQLIYLLDGGFVKGKILSVPSDTSRQIQLVDGSIVEVPQYLLDKGLIKGEVLENAKVPAYRVQLADGSVMDVPEKMVHKIRPTSQKTKVLPGGYTIRPTGAYLRVDQNLLVGCEGNDCIQTAYNYGFAFAGGYQFNRWAGIGAGIGADLMGPDVTFLPLFIETRGYLTEGPVSLYYTLQLGTSPFAQYLGREETETNNTRSGLLFDPAIGLRFASRSKYNWYLDAGVKRSTFQEISTFGTTTFQDDYRITRWAIRIGLDIF